MVKAYYAFKTISPIINDFRLSTQCITHRYDICYNSETECDIFLTFICTVSFPFHSRFKIQAKRVDETEESMKEYYPWVTEEKQPENNEWYFETKYDDNKNGDCVRTTLDMEYLRDPANNFCCNDGCITFMLCYSTSCSVIPIEGFVMK